MQETIVIPKGTELKPGVRLNGYEVLGVVFPTPWKKTTHLRLCAGADMFEADIRVGLNTATVQAIVEI